jgi:hypothetical protein
MGGDGTFAEAAKESSARSTRRCRPGHAADRHRERSGQVVRAGCGPWALERNVKVIAEGYTVGCDVGGSTIERGLKESIADCSSTSFSVGLGRRASRRAIATASGSADPGLGMIYRDQLVYIGAVAQRFFESYVVDTKFDLDAVIDGTVHHFPSLLDVIVKNTRISAANGSSARMPKPTTARSSWCRSSEARFLRQVVGRCGTCRSGWTTSRSSASSTRRRSRHAHELSRAHRGRIYPAAQVDGEEIPAGARLQ